MDPANRFEWNVVTCKPEETLEALKTLEMDIWTIKSVSPLPPDSATLDTRIMVVAYRSLATMQAIACLRHEAPGKTFPHGKDLVPWDGRYHSDCGHHKDLLMRRGDPFVPCDRCERNVSWKMVDLP